MNLPSHDHTEEKGRSAPSEVVPPSAESDRSIFSKIRPQATSWKSFVMLGLVSVGLHLLALRIPVPAIQPVSKKNQPIKVTRLTVAPKPKRIVQQVAPPKTLAKPSPSVRSPRGQNRLVRRAAIVPPRQLSPAPVKFSSPVSIASPSPVPVASPNSSPPADAPSPQSIPSPSPSPAPDQSQKPDSAFTFPPYPGANFSLKVSALTTKDDFKMVVDHFDKALLGDQKQEWNSTVIINEPSRKVYQVSKGGATKFLSVLSKGTLTAYLLTDSPVNDEDLEKASQATSNFGGP
jgi:hypothetical protein